MVNLLLLLLGAYEAAGDAKHFEVSGFPKHVLFELGLNRGQTLNDLLTSEGTDRNLLRPILNGLSQSDRFSPSEWCIHGFEANPAFTAELQQLESSLSKRGLCVRLNTETVAADANRITTFYIDGRKDAMHGKNAKYFAEGSTTDRDAGKKLSKDDQRHFYRFRFILGYASTGKRKAGWSTRCIAYGSRRW